MSRKSKIDKLGIGAKLCAYAQGGMPHNEIIEKVRREHAGAGLSFSQVSRYLTKHTANNANEPPPSAIIKQVSIETFREALLDVVNEAKSNYERYRDDPKGGWAWFKHWLSSVDTMGKAVGGYTPEGQVNVAVGVFPYKRSPNEKDFCPYKRGYCPLEDGESFEDHLKRYEAVFQSIEDARICPHCGKLENEKEMNTNV